MYGAVGTIIKASGKGYRATRRNLNWGGMLLLEEDPKGEAASKGVKRLSEGVGWNLYKSCTEMQKELVKTFEFIEKTPRIKKIVQTLKIQFYEP